MSGVASARDAAAALVARHCPSFERRIALPQGTLRLASNDEALLEALSRYYRPFRGEPAAVPEIRATLIERPAPEPLALFGQPTAGEAETKHRVRRFPDGRLVRKNRTGLTGAYGPRNVIAGPCRERLNQVVNALNELLIAARGARGWLLAHAGAVARAGRGIAIAAASGAGKTTLVLELLRREWALMTNDRLLLRDRPDGVRGLGVAKRPRVNPGTIVHNPALFSLMPRETRRAHAARPAEELRALEAKRDVEIERCFGPGRIVPTARVDAVVFLGWGGRGPSRLERVRIESRPDLVATFAKPTAPDASPDPAPHTAVLSRLAVFELTGGIDFTAGADSVAALATAAGAA